MFRRPRATYGDTIQIPLNATSAFLRVVHVSRHFRDVMQLELLGFGEFDDEIEASSSGRQLVWTACVGFSKRGWRVVSTDTTSPGDEDLTYRIVAQELWQSDVLVRRATRIDTEQYPPMLVDGFVFLERRLQRIADGA
mgnify:CR=1 FL=1